MKSAANTSTSPKDSFFDNNTVSSFLEGKNNKKELARWLFEKISQYKKDIIEYCTEKYITDIVTTYITHSLDTLLKPLYEEINPGEEMSIPQYQFNKINFSHDEKEKINLIFQKIAMDLSKEVNDKNKKIRKENKSHRPSSVEVAGKNFFKKNFYRPARLALRIFFHEDILNRVNAGNKPYGLYAN